MQAETLDLSWPLFSQNATDCMKNSEEIAVKWILINGLCGQCSPWSTAHTALLEIYVHFKLHRLKYRSSTSIHRNGRWKKRLQIVFVCKTPSAGRACDRALSRLTISSGWAYSGRKAKWPNAEIKILNQPMALAPLLSCLLENVRINSSLLVSLENVTSLSNMRYQGCMLLSWGVLALAPQSPCWIPLFRWELGRGWVLKQILMVAL